MQEPLSSDAEEVCAVHDVAEAVSPVPDDEDGNHKALRTGPKQPVIEPDDA